ncbi:MAG: dihydropteroate synthase [Dehalococcoidia bacterium]
MPRVIESPDQFIIIGENIHTTRVVRRNGVRATTLEDGVEAVTYTGQNGEIRYVTVPEHFKKTQPYEQGNLKHFMIAVWKGVHGDADEEAEAAAYIHHEANRQVAAGAHFLDLNVDEVSYKLDEQKQSMEWLVQTAQQVSSVPLSIDSSNVEIIETGLNAYDGSRGRPMLNSVALERIDALDLIGVHDARVVVTAASVDGMPSDAADRVRNVGEITEAALSRGVPASDIYIDALVFPISVAAEYGRHYLDAVMEIRQQFGNEIHITGGLSNVSFGLPVRKLINETFIHLAIQHGADSGIIDPIQTRAGNVYNLDTESTPVKTATALLMGEDEYCVNYLKAYRAGELS